MNFVNILYFLVLFGALQGVLILVALHRIKEGNRSANRLLAALILSISFILICRLSYGPIFFWQPKLAMIPDIIVFLFGPLVYLYIQALLIDSFKLTGKQYFHFLPALVHFGILFKSFLIPNSMYLEMYQAGVFYLRNYIILGLALLHCITYMGLSLMILRNYHKKAAQSFSFQQKTKYLNWIVSLMGVCLITWLASYLYAVSTDRPSLDFHFYNFLWIALSFVTYFLGYFAMTKPEIFQLNASSTPKYQSSLVAKEALDDLQKKLNELMSQEKTYLQSNLTLDELAKSLNSNAHMVSRLINERYHMNFFHFINSYRVEEFIQLVRQGRHKNLTFLAIAYAVGFSNKTSFNKAFKQVTNQTPREFIQSL